MRREVVVLATFAAAYPASSAAQAEWHLSSTPVAVVGAAISPGHELFRVVDATKLPDGRLIVLNSGTNEIRVFDSSGELIDRFGREGEGPGEYQQLRAIRGDGSGGFWVHDSRAGRVTHLDENFEVIDTRRVGYDLGAGIPVPGRFRPFEDGAIPLARGVLTMMQSHARKPGLHHDSVSLSVHRDGALREVARLTRGQTFGVRVGTSGITRPIPFGETAVYGSGPRSFVIGTSHSRRFQVLDAQGEVIKTLQARGEIRGVTSRDWALFQEDLRAQYQSALRLRGVSIEREPVIETFLAETPRGRDFPLFDAATIDGLGRVWVREYSLGDPVRRWQILGEAGVVAVLDVPAQWEVLEFGRAHVVVLLKDEFDVESVGVYEIGQ